MPVSAGAAVTLSAGFRCSRTQKRLERFAKLVFNIYVFEDREVGACFGLLKATLFASDDHNGYIRQPGILFYRADEFASAHPGHLHVCDNKIGANGLQYFQGFEPIGCGLDRERALLKKAANGVPDKHRVVHY